MNAEEFPFVRAICVAEEAGDNDAKAKAQVALEAFRKSRAPSPPKSRVRPIESSAVFSREKHPVRVDVDEHRVLDDVEIGLANDPSVYAVGRQVSEVHGSTVHAMTKDRVRDKSTECCFFYKPKKKDDGTVVQIPDAPPSYVGPAILSRPALKLRKLDGVVTSPILTLDGGIVDVPGYHEETRLLYVPECRFPGIEPKPTLEHAHDAAARITEYFIDFPYQDRELGLALALASVLTILARHLFDCAPVHVISSSAPGSGKGLETDTITTIALGRCAARSKWPREEEEQCKLLDGFARRAELTPLLDNIVNPLGGPDLERYVTSREVDVRVLGRTETRRLPWRGFFMATGNNVKFVGDITRRSLLTRLVPLDDRPDCRSDWRYQPLLKFVSEARPRLVVDALTILSAHARKGRPRAPRSDAWGSFDGWTSIVADAVYWSHGTDPLEARVAREASSDTAVNALESLIRMWLAFGAPAGKEVAASQFLARVACDAEANSFLDELLDEQVPVRGKQTRAGRLSTLLGRHIERWAMVDGKLLGFVKGEKKGEYGVPWKVVTA